MSLVVSEGSGKSYAPPPEGNHIARCVSIIDIGTQDNEWQGESRPRAQIIIGFELPEEMMDTDEGPRPFMVTKFFTNSLHEKATLRSFVEAWRGRAFTSEELQGFNLKNILDAPCQLTVVHREKQGGGVKADITSISKMHKSMTCPARVNDLVLFDIDEPDMSVFEGFSDGMKKLIGKSHEWQALKKNSKTGSVPSEFFVPHDDDIPF